MPKFVWKDGGFRDPTTGEAMHLPYAGQVTLPQYQPDTPGYHSPITGEWIEGRKARRDDLKKHGCVDGGDIKPRNGGRVKSEAFARKHNLKWEGD